MFASFFSRCSPARSFGVGIFLVFALATFQSAWCAQSFETADIDSPVDAGAPFVLKISQNQKVRPNAREVNGMSPSDAPIWQLLQKNSAEVPGFLIGSWRMMESGALAAADFQPVSPPSLGAALGLATVRKPDTAGWFLSVGRRVHLRTTNPQVDNETFSYESLAKMGWAVGVPADALPSARILWDSGRDSSLDLEEFLARAAGEAAPTGAWLVAGIVDFEVVNGQALKRSPADGTAMTSTYDPSDPDRFFFSPVQETGLRTLMVALVVEGNPTGEVPRCLVRDFFPPFKARTEAGHLLRAHYAELSQPLPPIDPSLPVQAMWEVQNWEDMPRVVTVREALGGSRVRAAHVAVYAIGSLPAFSLYEIPELVDLKEIDPTLQSEQRWATGNTFVTEPIYEKPRLLLRKEVAERIARINAGLKGQGLQLKIYDAYRPLSVTQRLFEMIPDHRYLAAPNVGSRHNRAAAVDVTLTDGQGRDLDMPSDYLVFDRSAHRDSPSMTPVQRRNVAILTEAMAAEGFGTINEEWWHYDAPGWVSYPVLDIPLWPEENSGVHRPRMTDGDLLKLPSLALPPRNETRSRLRDRLERDRQPEVQEPDPTPRPRRQLRDRFFGEPVDGDAEKPAFEPQSRVSAVAGLAVSGVVEFPVVQREDAPPVWLEESLDFLPRGVSVRLWQSRLYLFLLCLAGFFAFMFWKSR